MRMRKRNRSKAGMRISSYLSGVDAPDVMPMVSGPFFKKPAVT
jgi:hypothetical protein